MQIRPFKALRFDPAVVGDVGGCVAPPYDVIDADEQQRLYEKSPYNIARITKPKMTGTDQYAQAAALFNGWVANSVLKPDPAEAIYAYVQDFRIRQERFQRKGFIALGKLRDFGPKVRPHENTLEAPKVDRLKLMHATAGQFGQVLMLYDDAEDITENIIGEVLKQQPVTDFTDDDGVRHRLFPIAKTQDVEAICKMMAGKHVVIADGHHRYETALNYYNQTKNPKASFRMMTFVNTHSEGVIILPTHRLVGNLKKFSVESLISDLKENFEVIEFKFSSVDQKRAAKQKMFTYINTEFQNGKNAFGIYAGGSRFYAAVLTNSEVMEAISGHSRGWLKLDVSVLHELVLEKLLGIGKPALDSERNIEYIKNIGNAVDDSIARVEGGEKQLVFFMNPTRIEQVRAVAAAGEKMPQKSTFFYPKVFTGLTIYKL